MSTTTAPELGHDLTVAEVAAHMRVRKTAIYDAIDRGDLAAYRIGPNGTRVTREALADWKAAMAVKVGK